MNRNEDRLNGGIDRRNRKVAGSARTLQVRDIARVETNCAVMAQPEDVREHYIRASADQLRILAGRHMGERVAVGLFGGLAWSDELKMSRDHARATAEQQLARLTAANDPGGPVAVGDALGSAIRALGQGHPLAPIADDLERQPNHADRDPA